MKILSPILFGVPANINHISCRYPILPRLFKMADEMQKHTKVYLEHFGYDESDFIQCEYPGCGARGVDIEHLVPRSRFGNTRKEEQDHISNLVCICRDHHNQATFGANQKEVKAILKEVVAKT